MLDAGCLASESFAASRLRVKQLRDKGEILTALKAATLHAKEDIRSLFFFSRPPVL
jgi:hypothetical protein